MHRRSSWNPLDPHPAGSTDRLARQLKPGLQSRTCSVASELACWHGAAAPTVTTGLFGTSSTLTVTAGA